MSALFGGSMPRMPGAAGLPGLGGQALPPGLTLPPGFPGKK
jgi:hypothetical protein